MKLFSITLLLFAPLLIWGRLVPRSLWIDEAVMFWTIKDGFAETIHRAVNYQNYSPLYNLVLLAVKQIVGSQEIALRLLSLIAAAGSCAVVYSLAKRVVGRDSALLALFFFMTLDDVVSAATNVRSYSFAMFFSAVSMLMLLRWMDGRELKHLAGYTLAIVGTIYSHYLFFAIVPFQLIYLGWEASRSPDLRRQVPKLAVALLATAVCLMPTLEQLSHMRARQSVLSFAPMPGWLDLIGAWFPPHVLLFCLAGIIAARAASPLSLELLKTKRPPELGLVVLWWLAPALICFALSIISGGSIFVGRYYSWAAPAGALLLAYLAHALPSDRARVFFVCGFAVAFLAGETRKYRGEEDWRAAVGKARQLLEEAPAPVLAFTGLVEGQDLSWLTQPEKKEYLLAPFSYYSLPSLPLPLPNECESHAAKKYLREDLLAKLEGAERLIAIVRITYVGAERWRVFSDDYFSECLSGLRFYRDKEFSFEHVKVITFQKSATRTPLRDTPL